ncbi:MAG: AAA domain-containing protein, partial [Methanosarcinales archaeon]|nr:AAA domain-containing protein [Methanosarcinales archaeon]
MVSSDPVAKWEEFIRSRYWDDLLELADSYPESRSLLIEFPDLDRYDPEFADLLLDNPDSLLEAAHAALREIDLPMDVVLEGAHVRIANLPYRLKTRDLRSDHIGKLIAIEGQVRTATEVRPKILAAAYECQRCGHTFYVSQSGTKYQEPYECPNEACDRRGPFKLLLARSRFIDAQKVRVQESPEDLRGGEQPQTLDVELEDDIAGEIFPGDRVVINGMLRSFQRTTQTGKSTYFDLFLDGISIEMTEQEFEEIEILPEDEQIILELSRSPDIYEKVIHSIAPSIYGYEDVKEALSLQLVSGFPKKLPDGARIRGDIHILLVGDPGIAKSQLLRYMAKISPRGIYTSGKSSTSAGLTATAIKDELGDGRWTIEAGALVLADKGIAAVDEMDKMTSEDRSALHEAMEQQSYHPLTEMQLSDGRKVRIGTMVEEMMAARPELAERGVDCQVLPLHGELSMLTTDLAGIFPAPINRLSRHAAPDRFIRIRYSSGREVLVTPEHPVYVFKDGIACVPACQVSPGDVVPAPGSLPCGNEDPELEAVEGQHPGEKFLKFPERLCPNLCRIVGCLTAQGHFRQGSGRGIAFSSKNEALVREMSSLMEEVFGIRPTTSSGSEGVVCLRFLSAGLCRWFEAHFRETVRAQSERRVPAAIFRCTKDGIREFLRAALLSSGGMESPSPAYVTASRGLAEDCQDLLLCLGISSRIEPSRIEGDGKGGGFRVCIAGDSRRKFEDLFFQNRSEEWEKRGMVASAGSRSFPYHSLLAAEVAPAALEGRCQGMARGGRLCGHSDGGYGPSFDSLAGYSEERSWRGVAASSALEEDHSLPVLRMTEAASAPGWPQCCAAPAIGAARGDIAHCGNGGHFDSMKARMGGSAFRLSRDLVDGSIEKFEDVERARIGDIRRLQVVEA